MSHLVENGSTVADAMRAAGYSENTLRAPSKLTRSEGFMQLLDEIGVTDTKLALKLNEGLDATRGDDDGEYPDYAVRHKYLTTGLMLRGLVQQGQGLNINFNNYATDQRTNYQLS